MLRMSVLLTDTETTMSTVFKDIKDKHENNCRE